MAYTKIVTGSGTQPGVNSHHLTTGWTLDGNAGNVSLSHTSNRIMFLNGNHQFERFTKTDTSTRVPEGKCSPGADPQYCWRFDTSISTNGDDVVSWNVTKPHVAPTPLVPPAPLVPALASMTAETEAFAQATGLDHDASEAEARAQRYVDNLRRGGH